MGKDLWKVASGFESFKATSNNKTASWLIWSLGNFPPIYGRRIGPTALKGLCLWGRLPLFSPRLFNDLFERVHDEQLQYNLSWLRQVNLVKC